MGRGGPPDQEWARPTPHFPRRARPGGCGKALTRWSAPFSSGLFRQRTGVPWRDLPTRFGRGKTVHDRHRGRSVDGTGRSSG
ncbi:transposase [Streptomyces noursei]